MPFVYLIGSLVGADQIKLVVRDSVEILAYTMKLKIVRHGLTTGFIIYIKELLWTAPEILRQKDKRYTGTPKGDVYSFAIIVHELETRSLPYSDCHLESEGTKKTAITSNL